ncbi:heavy-metal-associated domain-containing protein [Sphingobacterium hungaricum]|uniref:HMA domain-containing protein n=1 Tax=Sphingobacterium hungaricum TaxID=2082723 RepID=A0A928UXB7_9SPHI|nr:hypothetical protein [Sphingobacterium hungaricum]MBE8712487.1 hypothetical protein [Sphingobacterium hungaricum]
MSTKQFKTTINCDACIAKVTPVLNADETITKWSVDTQNPDKILTVEGESIDSDDLVHTLKKIGYSAVEL